jgi:hypothetical protein
MKIIEILKEIKDPRAYNGKEYQLWQIILFSIFAIMSNAKNYLDIQRFIEERFDKLRSIFKLKWRRFPTHSAIWKILTRVDPNEIEIAFQKIAATMQSEVEDRPHICVDGKALRGSSSETRNCDPLRIFNAFRTDIEAIIAHVSMDSNKDSEIVAFEKMLDQLNIEGAVITADALHCQKKTSI